MNDNELRAIIEQVLTEMNVSGTASASADGNAVKTAVVNAVKNVCKDVTDGRQNVDDIDDEVFSSYLYTENQPDVDLLIRTSGEQRLSNFMLWQVSYAEMWFTDKLWPDFKPTDLHKAIIDFQNRGRRFGGV